MTDADERAFLDFVLSEPDAHFLIGRFHESEQPKLKREVPHIGTTRQLELVRTSIRSPVVLSGRGEGEFEGKFLLDAYRDPHIEFDRCFIENGRLEPGRLYSKIGWCRVEAENAALEKWYKSLAGWLRRRYVKRGTYWLGPGAQTWLQHGGRTAINVAVNNDA